MSDKTPAAVRTLVPIAVGPLVARFTPGAADDPDVLLGISAVAGYGYWVVVRTLETHFPKAGYLLGVAKTPTYAKDSGLPPFPPKETVAESALAVAVDQPTQTDNSPKDDDGPQDHPFEDIEQFTGEMR